MPIRESEKHRYPPDWKQIRARILERAGHRCEFCGVPNHLWVWRDESGKWHRAGKRALQDAGFLKPPFDVACVFENGRVGKIRVIQIVLTIAHLNHTPEDNRDENLKALCQRCHLNYDAKHHAKNAAATRRAKKYNLELFEM